MFILILVYYCNAQNIHHHLKGVLLRHVRIAVLLPLSAYGTDLGPVLPKSVCGDLLERDVPLTPSEVPVEERSLLPIAAVCDDKWWN
jgi:hypothetical protein